MTRAIAAAGVLSLCGIVFAAGEQAPAAVFTAGQAAAGKADYAKHCASCHMSDLSGNIEIPALAGKPFMDTWGTRSTKALFEYLSTAMPYSAPPLTSESYLAITAYILQVNGAIPGADEMSPATTVSIDNITTKH